MSFLKAREHDVSRAEEGFKEPRRSRSYIKKRENSAGISFIFLNTNLAQGLIKKGKWVAQEGALVGYSTKKEFDFRILGRFWVLF